MDADRFRRQYESGFVRLPGGFGTDAAVGMAEALCAELGRRHGVRPDDPATWTASRPAGLGSLRQAGAFDGLGTDRVAAAVATLLGTSDWDRPTGWGGALVTFPASPTSPTPAEWAVPSSGWHLDWPARGASPSQLLVTWIGYVTPVGPSGGATEACPSPAPPHLAAMTARRPDASPPGPCGDGPGGSGGPVDRGEVSRPGGFRG